MTAHLTEAELKVFAEGQAATGQARSHFDSCPDCRAAVARHQSVATRTGQLGAAPLPAEQTPLAPGGTVGRYVIIDRVGSGGMGVVYRAYDPELNRRVAIKLHRAAGADSPGGHGNQQQLLREAQAMARLSHPNTVPVFDVGTLGGDVFVAMEYVEGQTLRAWLAEKPRRTSDVVATFCHAGAGLAAAHRAGLLHLDFKPDNVMVGADGRVRVMDFGLARGLTELATPSSATAGHPGAPVSVEGTLAYMAPEQLLAQTAGPATDQFSFCVSLYEALFGQRPFQKLEADAAAPERWQVPELASGEVPAWLRRIIFKGLSLGPAERYPSLDALLAELSHDPSVTRRRWGLAAAALALLLLPFGAWGVIHRQREAQCEGFGEQLHGVWDGPTKTHLAEVFSGTGALEANDSWQRTHKLLEQYATEWVAARGLACQTARAHIPGSDELAGLKVTCLERRLAGFKALGALLASADAALVRRAVDAAQSLPPLGECDNPGALKEHRSTGEDPAKAREVDAVREQAVPVQALLYAGSYAEGTVAAAALVSRARQVNDAPLLAEMLLLQGQHEKRMHPLEAQQHLEESALLAIAARADNMATEAAAALIWPLTENSRMEAAHHWVDIAKALVTRTGSQPAHLDAFEDNTASLLYREGRFAETIATCHAALDRLRQLKPRRPLSEANLLNTLANALSSLGEFDQAEQSYHEVLAIRVPELGPQHRDVWAVRGNLAIILDERGKPAEAVVEDEQLIEYSLRVEGPEGFDTLIYRANAAGHWLHTGRPDKARAHLEQVVEIGSRTTEPDNLLVLNAHAMLAECSLAEGRPAEALKVFETALARLEKAFGPQHPDLALALLGVGKSLLALSRPLEAIAPLERAVRLRVETASEPAELAEARLTLAQAIFAGRHDQTASRALARQAADDFAALKLPARAEQAERWLAAHPP